MKPQSASSSNKSDGRPTFRSMEPAECYALLAAHHIGRLAYSFHDRVEIEPINYAYADGWIYMRTSAGAKLLTLRHQPWVAFEIDVARGPYDWESVVVHGTFREFHAEQVPSDRELQTQALEALRQFVPRALTEDDPTPKRDRVCGISVGEVIGRASSTAER